MLSGQLEQNLAVQQQEKNGWFLSSENTLEHKHLLLINYIINGAVWKEKEPLYSGAFE